MRAELVKRFVELVTKDTTPSELEQIMARARAVLTESEYIAFLGELSILLNSD